VPHDGTRSERRRRSDAGRGPHRPGGGRVSAAGGRAGPGEAHRGRGHPPAALAGGEPERRAAGPRGLLLRRGRGAPGRRAARRAAGGPGCAAGHRRGYPGDQRSRLPAGRGGRGGGHQGDGAAWTFRGNHRAGRVRAAHRQVLLRGVSAPAPGRAGQALRRARRRPPHPGLLRVRPQAGEHAGRALLLARRGPAGGGVPRAHQDPRGDPARYRGRAGRPDLLSRRPRGDHARRRRGRPRRRPACPRRGRRPGR